MHLDRRARTGWLLLYSCPQLSGGSLDSDYARAICGKESLCSRATGRWTDGERREEWSESRRNSETARRQAYGNHQVRVTIPIETLVNEARDTMSKISSS